jgi:hypothetical protein
LIVNIWRSLEPIVILAGYSALLLDNSLLIKLGSSLSLSRSLFPRSRAGSEHRRLAVVQSSFLRLKSVFRSQICFRKNVLQQADPYWHGGAHYDFGRAGRAGPSRNRTVFD